jgi:hypothetical protein
MPPASMTLWAGKPESDREETPQRSGQTMADITLDPAQ